MLDAKSAREMSMTADKERSDIELKAVEREITKACDNGHTSVNIKGQLQSTTTKRLENMGYVVEFFDDQVEFFDDQKEREMWTTISW